MTPGKVSKPGGRRGKPVRDGLLAAAETLLMEGMPPDKIALGDVLERADVARATLYHHFTDLEGLIGEAIINLYAKNVRGDIETIRALVVGSASTEAFGVQLKTVTQASQSEQRRYSRTLRAAFICYARTRETIAEKLSACQAELTREMAAVIAEGQARQLLRADMDAWGMAVFIQAYTLGKLVDDISAEKMPAGVWEDLINWLVTERVLHADV